MCPQQEQFKVQLNHTPPRLRLLAVGGPFFQFSFRLFRWTVFVRAGGGSAGMSLMLLVDSFDSLRAQERTVRHVKEHRWAYLFERCQIFPPRDMDGHSGTERQKSERRCSSWTMRALNLSLKVCSLSWHQNIPSGPTKQKEMAPA